MVEIFAADDAVVAEDRIIDIGLVVGLDYRNPTLDPHHEFQRYKMHPSIRPLLEGGKMISAGAKAIPEGGYFSMPRMYGEGFLIAGDSAGYLNGARLKGIHLGIKSGAMAAETAFQALVNEDYSSAQLSEYEAMFEASWARAKNSTIEVPGVDTWNFTDTRVTPQIRGGGIGFFENNEGLNKQYQGNYIRRQWKSNCKGN